MKKFLVTLTLLIAFLSIAFGQATDKSDKTRTALLKLTHQITTAKSHKDVAQLGCCYAIDADRAAMNFCAHRSPKPISVVRRTVYTLRLR